MSRCLLAVMAACSLMAQTRIDLSRQAREVDFSAAPSTKPVKMGSDLPNACSVGELFFKSDAPSGSNLYVCSPSNTWTPQSGISPQNCRIDSADQLWKCTDTGGKTYVMVKSAPGATSNQWVDYIGADGVAHTSKPDAAAVGAVADPGANGIPYRSGAGAASTADASKLSGPFFCQDAGSGNTYGCNLSPAPASYSAGTTYWFRANAPNSGSATVNFNGLGRRPDPQTVQSAAGGRRYQSRAVGNAYL